MVIILIFIFGLIVGSFLNVVVSRGAKNEKLSGRSYCDNCGKILAWYELIPILSYFIQRARCRSCNSKIPVQYFLVELATALLFVGLFWKFNSINIHLFYYFAAVCFWIVLFVFDLRYYAIPDAVILPAIFISLFYRFYFILTNNGNWLIAGLSVLIGAGLFFVLVVVSREKWMGWGDVFLGVFLGLFLGGWQNTFLALIISFIIGGIFAIILMLLKQKKFGDHLPFGPFLISGGLMALFFGDFIINWYLGIFL